MDLSVEVRDSKFSTELFDKRDNLSLYINHMPHLDTNVPPKIYYASIGSEIVCIARTTTDLINMVKRVNLLLLRMKSKLVNVPASFHYWKIFLGKTLMCFISLQTQLINQLSFSLCNYFCVCVCIILCVYVFICIYSILRV